jgi:hypothetical protein
MEETDSVLTSFVQDLATSPIFAEVSIDMPWLGWLAEQVLAHAVLDQLLRYNGFVVSGIVAADQARGTGRRLIYLRPETWAPTQRRHYAGAGAPGGAMQRTCAEVRISAARGRGSGCVGAGPVAEAAQAPGPSEDGGEGCHAIADGARQGTSCQSMTMEQAPPAPETVNGVASLLPNGFGDRCGVGKPFSVRNRTELKFPFTAEQTPHGRPSCGVDVYCHVCVYAGRLCVKPTRVCADVRGEGPPFFVHKVITQFAVMVKSVGNVVSTVPTAIFANPHLKWRFKEEVPDVRATSAQSKLGWVKRVFSRLQCAGKLGVNAGVVADFTVTKPGDAASCSQPSCKLSPGDDVVVCAVEGGSEEFEEGALQIWRHRDCRHVDGLKVNKFDTRVIQGRPRNADGVVPVGHKLAIRTEEDVPDAGCWLVVAVSLYAYAQKGAKLIEVNGDDRPMQKWWDVVKLVQ